MGTPTARSRSAFTIRERKDFIRDNDRTLKEKKTMIKIEIKGLNETIKYLDDIAKKQLPFATAKALTMTAQDVQKKMIEVMPERFTVRSGWYRSGPFAFKIKAATKSNLQAEVYTNAPWMSIQESGGEKMPLAGRKMIAIPTRGSRPNKKQLIPEHLRPAFLLHGQIGHTQSKSKRKRLKWGKMRYASSAFIGKVKDDRLGIWMTEPSGKLKLMYQLESMADVDARLMFKQTAKRIVDEKFNQNFGTAFKETMRSAK
jgi:hypothetical protein